MRPPEVLDRRRVLRHLGSSLLTIAAGSAVDGCTAEGRSPHTARRAAKSGQTLVPWKALAAGLAGRVVVPGSPEYPSRAQLYNERFDGIRPAAIVLCSGPNDVQRAIDFGRRYALPLSIRSGGHSYGGYSSGPGMVIDVSTMADVTVGAGSAHVGAGTRLVDMYATLARQGLMVPGGSCPTVGIAGLALGGGIGVLARRYGLTCDNVRSLRMVTADSRVITASPSEHPDLYWASRGGGGGNFGVVTSFEFAVHELPPTTLFTLNWPWRAAEQVLGAWQDWIARAPAELWSNCQLLAGGSGGVSVKVTGVFCGDPPAAADAVAPLVAAVGPPVGRFVGSEGFLRAMLIEAGCEATDVAGCHLSSKDPRGGLQRPYFLAKSLFIDDPLPPPSITGVTDLVEGFSHEAPDLGGAVVFDSYGGVIAETPRDATAFVHRSALAGIQMTVDLGRPTEADLAYAHTWLEHVAGGLAPHASGAYVNYLDPALADWPTAYYGSNLKRLERVKRAADPDDVFRFAQAIPGGPRGV